MSRANSLKLIAFTIVFVLDLLLVPTILDLPRFIKLYGANGPTQFFNNIDLLGTTIKAFTDPGFRMLFLTSQPVVLSLIIYMLWKNTFTRKNKKIVGIGGPKAAGSGQFGTSRWLTDKEVDKLTTIWHPEQPIKTGGIVLGMQQPYNTLSKEGMKVWLETNDTHSLIIGTSRSGKTRTFILPTIYSLAYSGESMVINDPKGELYRKTSKFLESKGYDVILLDFRNPSRGNRWNPMKLIVDWLKEGNESLASEAAWDMAHTVVHQQKRSGDPIWANGEESVIAALSLAIAQDADYEEQKHLNSAYTTLIELGKPIQTEEGEYVALNEFFNELPAGNIAKQAFGSAALAPDRQRGSFYSGAATDLRLFGDPGIANLTSTQDHDLADVGRKPTAVFMIVPDEKTTRHVLASLYVDQCYQALVTLASQHNDRLPNRVNFLLDEFGNMPPINGMDNKITVAAGRGIRFHLVVQALGQLKEKYGDKTDIIKGNTHTWIYLLSTDIQTSEEISKKTGTYSVETQNYSSNAQPKSYSHGMSSSLMQRSLLTPDEVRRWEYGKALVFLQRQNPAHLPLPDYTEWPANDEFIEIEDVFEQADLIKVPIYIPYITSTLGDLQTQNMVEQEKEEESKPPVSVIQSLDEFSISSDEIAVTLENEDKATIDEQISEVETPEEMENVHFEVPAEEVTIPFEEYEVSFEEELFNSTETSVDLNIENELSEIDQNQSFSLKDIQ